MQGFQHSVLHADRKRGFCHVQWIMDNEGQEDYECRRGMPAEASSFALSFSGRKHSFLNVMLSFYKQSNLTFVAHDRKR